ncbi:ribosomal-processing cysteine protease Prp [Shimazuella alba]|jgi:uncharacterized protein YsxB (DUF464 family)|uniref:Ribosomal processing cysteine protease Prp n=1 Tax=Shimazuella alba TaxID=2690964 RepID=A0A6I4VYM2_9BACL|nr:ribosomal-processing cysteine protease Prp [Shimazuella alba]MXQ55030.1 ribosomal-processing cysteine protease Prp [Shimazuella alba]
MIRIRVKRNQAELVEQIKVTGHANFAEHGMDIVCAAVSAVTIGMVNAMEQITGVTIHQPDDGEGKVDCRVPADLPTEEVRTQLGLLMRAMDLSLKGIADAYPDYVQYKQN